MSSAFGFRQFRRLGASEGLAAWTLVATFVFSALGLALLATVGIVVAERQGSAFDLVGVTVGILGTALIGAAIVYQRRALFRLLGRAFVLSHRLTGFPRRPGEDVALSIAASLNEVTFRLRDLLGVLAWSVASWVLDCSCLVFAYLAVGAEMPGAASFSPMVQGSWRRTCRSPPAGLGSSKAAS